MARSNGASGTVRRYGYEWEVVSKVLKSMSSSEEISHTIGTGSTRMMHEIEIPNPISYLSECLFEHLVNVAEELDYSTLHGPGGVNRHSRQKEHISYWHLE